MARENRSRSKGSPLLQRRLAQIRACERSGETLKAFAERRGLSVQALYQARKLARRQGLLAPARGPAKKQRPGRSPRFVEAVGAPPPISAGPVSWRLRFAGGEVLESSSPLCGDEALQLVELLRSQS